MPRRTYGQVCPIAHALDLVGERWMLLVVRELLLGPKRFSDLRADLPRIGANLLSARLRHLEAISVVSRRRLAPPAASWVYELTERGRELGDVLLRLGRWGAGSSTLADLDGVARPEWTVLALKTQYQEGRAAGAPPSVELRFGDEVYSLRVADEGLSIERGAADDADLVLSLELATFIRILRGELRARDARGAGLTIVRGSLAAAERFVRLFA